MFAYIDRDKTTGLYSALLVGPKNRVVIRRDGFETGDAAMGYVSQLTANYGKQCIVFPPSDEKGE